jgi:hypothetical protein
MKDLKDQYHNIFREVYILINDEFVKLGAVEDSLWEFICDNYSPVEKSSQKEIDMNLDLCEIAKIRFD